MKNPVLNRNGYGYIALDLLNRQKWKNQNRHGGKNLSFYSTLRLRPLGSC